MLQTPLPGWPGLLVVVEPLGDAAVLEWQRGKWRVCLWDWNLSHMDFGFDDFPSADAAIRYAEREFLIEPAMWEPCAAAGAPETLAGAIRRVYPRRLTCAEAAAFAQFAYGYEYIDGRGRPIFPGDERCITSFNVIAGVLDTLDWNREDCALFPAPGASSYGFVADATDLAGLVEALPEFGAMREALLAGADIGGWRREGEVRQIPAMTIAEGLLAPLVRRLMSKERSLSYQTGYIGQCFGLGRGQHVFTVAARASEKAGEDWSEFRAIEVMASSAAEVLLHRGRADGSVTSYLTGVDGRLRQALWRPDDREPVHERGLDQERDNYAEELHAWLAWRGDGPATAFDAVSAPEVDELLGSAAADDAGLERAVAFLRSRHVFVAEAMSGAPPHVVRRVVLAALESLKGRSR